MKRIAIVGGGMAGVTAAYELSRRRRAGAEATFTLFEASERLGGIVETVRQNGFVIECGPDGWVSEKPWARELAEELGLGPEIIPSNDGIRKTYVFAGGRLQAIPDGMRMMVPGDLQALDTSGLFSVAARHAYHQEVERAAELKASAPVADESVASFVRRHFGDEVLLTIGAPLLSGIFGGDVESLSVRAVMAPFVAMEKEHGSLVAALQARASRTEHTAIFTTLRSGLGTLIDQLAAQIPPESIRLQEPVTSIGRSNREWTVSSASARESFDHLLLATPPHIARSLVAPLDAPAADLMDMEASSSSVVAFCFRSAPVLPVPAGFGFLVPPDAGRALLACTFVDQKFGSRVPPGGRLLRAFLGNQAAVHGMGATDDEIADLAWTELTAVLGSLPVADFAVVRRWPRSLPQYAVGHLDRMAELDRRIRTLPSLALLGSGYRGVGLPDIIRDARLFARAALQA